MPRRASAAGQPRSGRTPENRQPASVEYVSRAEPYPLFLWPRRVFWLVALTCALAPALAGVAWDRRRVEAVGVTV